MALENTQKGNYISILGGRFCKRVKEGTEGAVTRKNKLNNTVHEVFYDKFSGNLIDIRIKESQDYGKSWEFVFEDDGEEYIIQLSYSNSYAKAFLKMLPNIDVTKRMTLVPSQKEVDGKTQSSLFVNQNGVAIKHAYTKDNPNGMPQMVQIKVKGNLVWDDTDILFFLTEMVNKDILPKLGKKGIENKKGEGEVESDDVPF